MFSGYHNETCICSTEKLRESPPNIFNEQGPIRFESKSVNELALIIAEKTGHSR